MYEYNKSAAAAHSDIGIKAEIEKTQDISTEAPKLPAVEKKQEQPTVCPEAIAYVAPPPEPTQEAVDGIRFDFNNGLRVRFPKEGEYRLVFRDLSTENLLFCMDVKPGCLVESVKKFYIPFSVEVFKRSDLTKPIFRHDLNLTAQDVLIQFPLGALGDTIAWFSYIERFQQKHQCRLFCTMPEYVADLFRNQYPNVYFVTRREAAELKPYATYNLGLFFKGDTDHQPYDFRQVGLHRSIGYILGLGDQIEDCPPRVDLSAPRTIKEKYVVIAAQASSQCKYWNNPSGWREVVAHLKSLGYRVLCIDKLPEYGCGIMFNHIPYGAEDFTGDKPLQERINLIKDADMFIGLSSGLSWLAWCCKVPVVMISGFTDPLNEFYTPYRVINPTVCHGCWNDMRCDFDHGDFLWCPRKNKDVDFMYECTKAISSKMVIDKIEKIVALRNDEIKEIQK